MNMFDLAHMLDGMEYGDELTEDVKRCAKDNELVIVTGASDDLMEFDGAISDEVDAYGGREVAVNYEGVVRMPCEHDPDFTRCPYYNDVVARAKKIKAVWCSQNSIFPWSYETELPHARFNIWEDGKPYCEGIVLNRLDLR